MLLFDLDQTRNQTKKNNNIQIRIEAYLLVDFISFEFKHTSSMFYTSSGLPFCFCFCFFDKFESMVHDQNERKRQMLGNLTNAYVHVCPSSNQCENWYIRCGSLSLDWSWHESMWTHFHDDDDDHRHHHHHRHQQTKGYTWVSNICRLVVYSRLVRLVVSYCKLSLLVRMGRQNEWMFNGLVISV